MGDIADSLIDGEFDFYTGEYLGQGVGYPRTHNRSLPWEQRTLNHKSGVTKYLIGKGVSDKQEQMKIIREFIGGKTDNDSKEQLCLQISSRWKEFTAWLTNRQRN